MSNVLQTIDETTAACIAEERKQHGEAFLRVDGEGRVSLISRDAVRSWMPREVLPTTDDVPVVVVEGPWTDLQRKQGGQ